MKLILERLIESVEEETGIKLTSRDFQVTGDSGELNVSIWGNSVLEMSYEDGELENDDFAEEVVEELFREHYDLKGKIVELKLDQLNEDLLPDLSEKILSKLEENKVDERLLDILDFEFMDMGYIQGNFSSPGDEEWDYPQISLRVTDYEDFEHYINIDPYKSLNEEAICAEIIKKIRGKI